MLSPEAGPYGLAAVDYLAAGWSPIPLPAGEKSPPPVGFTGYAGRQVTTADVEQWRNGGRLAGGPPARLGNLAVRLADDVLGLDVDAYSGKAGARTLAEAEARLGPLPPTVVSSARDDGHSGIRLYRVAAGRRWADTLGPGVEVIHHGHRYVVAAPSVHPETGLPYRWTGQRTGAVLTTPPDPAELPELPPRWVAELDAGPIGALSAADPLAGTGLLDELAADDREPCRALSAQLGALADELRRGQGRHDLTRDRVMALVRLGEQGHHGAGGALAGAEAMFLSALRGERACRGRGAPAEWARMVDGAAAKVAADPAPDHLRGCCGDESRQARLSAEWAGIELVIGADEDDDDAGATADADVSESSADQDNPLLAPEFWAARPILTQVYEAARARRTGPWALLGAVLARAVASITPGLMLPPTIGGTVSLNLFVALCGPSGSGKSGAMAVAEELLEPVGGVSCLRTAPGTGEGLLAAYGGTVKDQTAGKWVMRQYRASVLLDVDEVGALAALAERTGATLVPFLVSAWTGRPLGTLNAETSRRRHLDAHSYRLAVVAGVQPERADVLLSDDAAAGGLPQRWLWLPTYDPEGLAAPGTAEPMAELAPSRWSVPGLPVYLDPVTEVITVERQRPMTLPAEAVEAMTAAARARNVPLGAAPGAGGGGELDGHTLLCRAKVAAVLALLDGREDVTGEDWRLAGTVMRVSAHTRQAVQRLRAAVRTREWETRAVRRGRADALAQVSAQKVLARRTAVVLHGALLRLVAVGEGSAGVSEGRLRKALPSRDREHAAAGLAWLVEAGGAVRNERANARGRTTVYYAPVAGWRP